MAGRIGLDMRLFRNTATPESPAWNEVTNCRDLTLNTERGEADLSTRGSGGWRIRKSTLANAEINFQLVYDPDDEDYTAFESAFFDKSTIQVAACDDQGNGLSIVGEVFNFSRNEGLEDAVTVDVTIRASDPSNPPEAVTGIGGS